MFEANWPFVIPSPTKLRGDIVTLPSVLPSVRHNPCEHSRINILQWILTKPGTYLDLKKIWNPIEFQGQRSRSQGLIFRRGDMLRFALPLLHMADLIQIFHGFNKLFPIIYMEMYSCRIVRNFKPLL